MTITTRLPAPEPLAECGCDACAALAQAIDADLRARLRVLEAAEIVDHRHNLNRTTPKRGEPTS